MPKRNSRANDTPPPSPINLEQLEAELETGAAIAHFMPFNTVQVMFLIMACQHALREATINNLAANVLRDLANHLSETALLGPETRKLIASGWKKT